jgi:osmotically inducible protein OsmC
LNGKKKMKRTATATWSGDFKQGKGTISTESGVLKATPYSFHSRFEDGKQTNPEELIGAAHAGCFTMALSVFLGKEGFTAEKLATTATVSLEQVDGNWTIVAVLLELKGSVPGITPEKFEEIAANAKQNCPVSRLLKANISLDCKLEKP